MNAATSLQILPRTAAVRRAPADSDPSTDELAAGLASRPARIDPKYLYDRLGARLFDAITELPEYYLTRTERALVERYAPDIARQAGERPTVIDLGAGNGEKAHLLLEALEPSQYVAVDISAHFLAGAVAAIAAARPGLATLAVGADLSRPLALPAGVGRSRRLFTYFGSSIGNFEPQAARRLLRGIRGLVDGEGGLVLGIDLVKPRARLEAAYDDVLGVTASFNLNVLNNVNAILGSDFDPADWRHRALFNAPRSRVEMHLEARRELEVRWPGGGRRFARGERIHTENSHKYRLPEFREALLAAGFDRVHAWTDDGGGFALLHARCDA